MFKGNGLNKIEYESPKISIAFLVVDNVLLFSPELAEFDNDGKDGGITEL